MVQKLIPLDPETLTSSPTFLKLKFPPIWSPVTKHSLSTDRAWASILFTCLLIRKSCQKLGKKQSVLRNFALKRKKGFKGTQKQEVAQKRRKETRAVEVTFVSKDDGCQRANSAPRRICFQTENTAKRRWKLLKWRYWRLFQWTIFLNLWREFTHKLHLI